MQSERSEKARATINELRGSRRSLGVERMTEMMERLKRAPRQMTGRYTESRKVYSWEGTCMSYWMSRTRFREREREKDEDYLTDTNEHKHLSKRLENFPILITRCELHVCK